jgi:hypothetical protein
MKMVSPSPLMGEGGGEGESKPLPLTSILSPGGERRDFKGYFLSNWEMIPHIRIVGYNNSTII